MNEGTEPKSEIEGGQFDPLINITTLVYALQAIAVILPPAFPIAYIVGVVVNYVKLDDVRGTWLESHFRWQIRTFWFSLLWFAISGILTIVLVGWAGIFATFVWVIYRIVKGWLDLNARKPMYRVVPAG